MTSKECGQLRAILIFRMLSRLRLKNGFGRAHGSLTLAAVTDCLHCASQVAPLQLLDSIIYQNTWSYPERNLAQSAARNVEFDQTNVLNLSSVRERYGTANIAITIRCLINLSSWEYQKRGIDEIAATLQPGGYYILSEGWSEGWNGLNRLRVRCGLEPMQLVKYNQLLDREQFEDYCRHSFEVIHYRGLGLYMLVSRIIQPLLVYLTRPVTIMN